MPVLARAGPASAASFGFNQGVSTLRVGSSIATSSGTSTAVSFPAGTAAGDFALIYVAFQGLSDNNSITGGAGGWTKDALAWSAGYYSAIFSKALAGGDLAGVSLSRPSAGAEGNSEYIVVVYRKPTTLTVKTTNSAASGTSLTLTGFTRAAGSLVVLSFIGDQNGASTPVIGSPFTAVRGPGAGVSFVANLSDVLVPTAYLGGNVVWGSLSNALPKAAYLVELT